MELWGCIYRTAKVFSIRFLHYSVVVILELLLMCIQDCILNPPNPYFQDVLLYFLLSMFNTHIKWKSRLTQPFTIQPFLLCHKWSVLITFNTDATSILSSKSYYFQYFILASKTSFSHIRSAGLERVLTQAKLSYIQMCVGVCFIVLFSKGTCLIYH